MYVEKDLADMVISPMCLLVPTMHVVRALKLSLKWDYHLIKDSVALVMRNQYSPAKIHALRKKE
jgi:hypothetical protein